jgi:hypothetical protein
MSEQLKIAIELARGGIPFVCLNPTLQTACTYLDMSWFRSANDNKINHEKTRA